jgi:hypothetical protein
MPVAQPSGVWWRLSVIIFVFAFGFAALWGAARASRDVLPATESIKIEQGVAPSPVVLVFIDSLSRDVATDAQRMPFLARLANEGASFDVEPCRDQLTYLCLRAALTGHDESSLLAIRDNFRPEHEGPPDTLFSALAAQGERVSVIGSNDSIHTGARCSWSTRCPKRRKHRTALVRCSPRPHPSTLASS